MNSTDFAIVVGASHYPSYRDLPGALPDAQRFSEWLVAANGGGVPKDHVIEVLSEPNPLVPLKQHIDDAFDVLDAKVRDVARARRVYFFFSGHGLGDDHSKGAGLCLADFAITSRPNAYVAMNEYCDLISRLGLADEIVCFLDCCRVNRPFARPQPPGRSPGTIATPASSILQFFGAPFNLPAFEAVHGQGEPPHGHFTTALMEGLTGTIEPEAEGISGTRLFNYLYSRVPELAAKEGRQQIPDRSWLGSKELYFGPMRDGSPSIVSTIRVVFTTPRQNVVLETPDLQPLHQGSANPTSEWLVNTPKLGLHLIRDLVSAQEQVIRVTTAGAQIHVTF